MPGTSTEQVVDKGIMQNSTKEWTHSLYGKCLLSGGHPKRVPSDYPTKNVITGVSIITSSQRLSHATSERVDAASGKTLKKRNA